MISVHPEAGRRITDLCADLVGIFGPIERPITSSPRGYAPDVPVVHTISAEEILGNRVTVLKDRFGREEARHVTDDEGVWGLQGEAFPQFLRAVRTFHQQPSVRSAVSRETVAGLLFEWIYETKRGRISAPVVDHLLSRLETLVADVEVVIPLFGLNVEVPVRIGNVVIADVSADEFNSWRDSAVNRARNQQDDVRQLFGRMRQKYQGRAAARYETRAEREHAIEIALGEADLSVAAVRLFSVGAFVPERPTSIALLGRERTPSAVYLLLGHDDAIVSGEFLLHGDDIESWTITNDKVPALERVTAHWSELLTRPQRSVFEDAALRSMLLYSRATQYRNISEKLIHIFSATESLLLRNDNEPISSAVAERLAFVVGTDADARLKIDRNLRDVYAMRSKFVHHALETAPDSDDLRTLEEFLKYISQFFMNLKQAMKKHPTKDSFLDELQRRKYQ